MESEVNLIWVTPEAEKLIGYTARVSSPNQDNPEIAGLLKYCIKHKHWSILEMASMCVEINTSRAIAQQILRHRSFHFQEFSQRYAEVPEDAVVIYKARRQDTKNRQNSTDDLPDSLVNAWYAEQEKVWKVAREAYSFAIMNGIAKECARMVLPVQTKTKMYMTGTIRDWIHYVNLRTANGTQLEHMEIAQKIKAILIKELPIISEANEWSI
jgi:thymidylate synthase (FAD)